VEGKDIFFSHQEFVVIHSFIHRCYRNDRNKVAQLRKDFDLVDIVKLEEEPEINLSPGHWLIRTAHPTFSNVKYCVDSVDISTRILSTRFRQKNGQIMTAKIPYDERGLVWFRERPDSDRAPTPITRPRGNSDEESVELLDEAPSIEKVAGYWVSQGENSENGLVDKINLKTRMMTVIFEGGIKQILYDEPGLLWMK
jgi:hypothetical protein